MKKILFISIFITSQGLALGQDSRFGISLSIGNNGQLDKLLNDFYWPGHETTWLSDAYTSTSINLKYSAALNYAMNDKISFRLKFGYYLRSDRDIQDAGNTFWDVKFRQKAFNINPSIFFSKKLDEFKFSFGLEVPLNFIGKMVSENYYKDTTNHYESYGKEEMNGGHVFGLNNYIMTQYYFSEHFAIFCEVTTGLLRANLGDKYKSTIIYNPAILPSTTNITDKTLKKLFFSPPEISFGVVFQF